MKAKVLQDKIIFERKQKTDLQDKLLNYYKDRLIINKEDDKGNLIEYNQEICDAYIKRIEEMLNQQHNRPNGNEEKT